MRWLLALALLLVGCDDPDCTDDATFWIESVAPLLTTECAGCHRAGGPAGSTGYLLTDGDDREAVQAFVAADPQRFLEKPTGGLNHGGAQRFDPYDPRYATLHEFVARVGSAWRASDEPPKRQTAR